MAKYDQGGGCECGVYKECQCNQPDMSTAVFPEKENKSIQPEAVNHPEHYSPGTYEAINVIEAHNLGFCLGNAVKYILRAGKKNPTKTKEDLDKAIWYLNRYKDSL